LKKKIGIVLGHVLAQGFSPVGKVGQLAHADGTAWALPRAVTAHCYRMVARPMQLTGDLPGDKIFNLMTVELQGDGRAR
jgi:hypothetical protein